MEKITPEAAQKAIEDQILGDMAKQDPNEGKIVAEQYTIDGPVFLVRKGGKDIPMKPPEVEVVEMPKAFKPQHENAVFVMESCISQIKEMKNRSIPLTREELIQSGVPKQIIKDLERMGIIKQQILSMVEQKTNKKVGGKLCIWFTPFGHAYLKKTLKELYNGSGPSDKGTSSDS